MADKGIELLQNAIARNLAATLSLPSAGMLRHYKSRFVGELDQAFILESPLNESALIHELVSTARPATVSFRAGINKVTFTSRILRVDNDWHMSSSVVIDAVFLEFPTHVKITQRREDYRVSVVADSGLVVRIWRISGAVRLSDPVASTQEVSTQVRNLSAGGIGVIFFGSDGNLPLVAPDDRLRIQLCFRDQDLILEGRMRGVSQANPDNSITTGIQFTRLENNLEGRRASAQLARILGQLQRDEARRAHLGLAALA